MQLSSTSYDPETVALMALVYNAALSELRAIRDPDRLSRMRNLLAIRIISAVDEGERDPERLKAIALTALYA